DQTLCFTYDALNQLLQKGEGSFQVNGAEETCTMTDVLATYEYGVDLTDHNVGKLVMTSWGDNPSDNHDTFFYDALGRMNKQERVIDGRAYAMETLTFDSLNRPLTIEYPNNEVITLTYDREGENSLTAGNDVLVNDVRYNAQGQMTYLDRSPSSAVDTAYTYFGQHDNAGGGVGDSNFRLQSITHGSLLGFNYQYDLIGNITQITSGSDTQNFTYDHLNRLDDVSGSYAEDYAYDALGNITTVDGATYSYIPDPARPYTHTQPHAVTGITGGQSFVYDANGNMTERNDGNDSYTQMFDVENRLTSVTKAGEGTTTFVYDAAGQRVMTEKPDGVTIYTPFPTYDETVYLHGYAWDFEEGAGDDVRDASSYHLDGQVGGAQWTNGLVGQALDFDGENDRVAFDEGIPIDGEMTVSAWVRPELAPTGIGRLIAGTYAYNGGGINRRGWYLGNAYGDVDQIRFLVNDQNGSQAYALYDGFFDQYLNQWVHVVGVFKPGQAVELYINGQLVDSATTDVPAAIGDSGIFRIGARADNYLQGNWDGKIDEIKILAQAMDAEQIRALNAVAVWQFDEGHDATV
ncbi:MAG: hypothetical protein GY803_31920, partial [Chloroflexi bacterium]|nr:hypothetical protein [Chloroflexota bacterium]